MVCPSMLFPQGTLLIHIVQKDPLPESAAVFVLSYLHGGKIRPGDPPVLADCFDDLQKVGKLFRVAAVLIFRGLLAEFPRQNQMPTMRQLYDFDSEAG